MSNSFRVAIVHWYNSSGKITGRIQKIGANDDPVEVGTPGYSMKAVLYRQSLLALSTHPPNIVAEIPPLLFTTTPRNSPFLLNGVQKIPNRFEMRQKIGD
jgi:hypothetical protein